MSRLDDILRDLTPEARLSHLRAQYLHDTEAAAREARELQCELDALRVKITAWHDALVTLLEAAK